MIPEITIKITMLPDSVAITKGQTGIAAEEFAILPPMEEGLEMTAGDFAVEPPMEEGSGIAAAEFAVPPPPGEVEGMDAGEYFIPPPDEEESVLDEDIGGVPEAPPSE